ncbi:MAG: hypothetical protein FJ100_00435 [Deltaproteobacteria bacterium]|nr:hypothetical protein [Deltaproteobacteria bacterium]
MGFLDSAPLGANADVLRAKVRKAPAGLEIATYWQSVAQATTDPQRRLLSYMVAALLARGWMLPVDRVLESAAETLGEAPAQVQAEFDALVALDLVTLDGPKIATLAGLLTTRPGSLVFKYDSQHEVGLVGPLAALAVGRALQKTGAVRASCAEDKAIKLTLQVDKDGVASRDPDGICAFLPAWNGQLVPTEATAGGVLLRDDDALGRWQESAGEPDGMPLTSLFFPMAAADLAGQVGAALESVLNHLPDFD